MAVIWAKQALLPTGWSQDVMVSIFDDGKIDSVQSGIDPSGQCVDILMPAPVNAHSHAFQRSMAGLTEHRGSDPNDSFWSWRKLMFRFLDQLTPDQVQAVSAFVQMQMLQAGYATNVEFHYLHHQPDGMPYDNLAEMSERIIAAADQSGIGLTLLPVHYQFGGCDGRPLAEGQRRFGNNPDQFGKLCDLVQKSLLQLPGDAMFGVAPHSLRAVNAGQFDAFSSLANGGPIHMHLAEQKAEVDEVRHILGCRPVEWVLENLDVNERWCMIHCTQLLPHETKGLARTGAIAGLCAITESSLGDGIFDAVGWFANAGKIAVGSDSNIRISLAEELRTLEYSQRLRDGTRAVMATQKQSTGRRIFDAVCAGGTCAAGRKTGAIAAGNWADLLALDNDHPDLVGCRGDKILDAFIFCGGNEMVRDVWSAGRHLVQKGRHIKQDQITRHYVDAVKQLRAMF
ncbi:formimidoylglutamate deiminase [Parasulfitobacter algicola]|uniref:Formimidoylglutamate deiminase n=1 Tax=Parasulfitobacter algicola TaxID=2614809 RepID=A0ABX2ITB1_9RHOB|nr:formimidoylglutamate deiminase [Sulfitobacter algicola]NSX56148.1 formimidoylglutamate deiminase [Sulfitobacter algicola]